MSICFNKGKVMKHLVTLIEFIWMMIIFSMMILANMCHPGWISYIYGVIVSGWMSWVVSDWVKQYNIK